MRRPSEELRWALKDITFEIRPAQLVPLVGASGVGKTTIRYLVPRLYDPGEGRITLDGVALPAGKLSSLTEAIGTITQETYLFRDAIRPNLLSAKPAATYQEPESVCRAANTYEYVVGLPEGYDIVVGERGYPLSGEEKQRVPIARVILNDPRILILDEATKHLDSRSESLIQKALERVLKGRTSFVIAHRLSTILSADLILVMDGGQLVEQGTHTELLAQDGNYAELYHIRFQPEANATS